MKLLSESENEEMMQGTLATASGAHESICIADFQPLPLLSNPHLQTLVANLWDGHIPPFPVALREVLLPDGDRLVLHDSAPEDWRPGKPMALLVHGLGGSHVSGYMRRMTALLWSQGFRAVRMDLRGCGRGESVARRLYNGGCSDDVRAAAEDLLHREPGSPLTLIGFSLGGNIVLKLAGEAADRPLDGLVRIAAMAPPIDLVQCSELISLRRNRLYERHYLRHMVKQVRRLERHHPVLPRAEFPRRLSLRIFDDLFTAPRGGYDDALDYYRRASSLPLISRIRIPTFIMTSRDDPFVAVGPFENLRVPSNVEVHICRHGGHLGFLGRDRTGGVRWAERRVADWVMQ